MKQRIYVTCALFICSLQAHAASYKSMVIDIPEMWSMQSSVIYNGAFNKVGEVTSKRSWPYKTGKEFTNSFKKGFVDDATTTKFISSGTEKGVYWVCRSGEYYDGKGGSGIWYSRVFWVKGPLVTFYSFKNCEEKFNRALKIAQTLREK